MSRTFRPFARAYVRLRGALWPRTNVRLAPQCPSCKYSLRGLAGKGVGKCPECGTPLVQHHFTGLYRVRSIRAWILTACAPMALTAGVSVLYLSNARTPPVTSNHPSVSIIANALLLVAIFSIATTLALAREVSHELPASIRSANWGGAVAGVVLLCGLSLFSAVFVALMIQ